MNSSEILELQKRIEALKEKQKDSFDALSIELNKLNKEQSKDVMPIYADIKKMQLMIENGNIDEKEIENIKAKYGTKTHK
jgi:acetyl-CoA carboxylase alpha subunit